MSPAPAYPNLRRLCGAYLNADFDVHGPRPEDAVEAFARTATPAVRAATRAEIARFLARHPSESGRLRALERMRMAVDLPHFGYASVASFLERVVARLSEVEPPTARGSGRPG